MSCVNIPEEIHVGDTGTLIEVTIMDGSDIVPLQAATVKKYHFLKPDGSVLTVNASFKTDGSNGILTYTSLASTFSLPGQYSIQAEVTLPSGTWKSEWAEFVVYPNIA